MAMEFRYDPAIVERYPGVRGGVILARGLKNGPTPPDLLHRYQEMQHTVKNRIGENALSEISSLAAWRRVFSSFGVKPTQYRSAAEALLRRLTKEGDIPSINCLVDLGNLVSTHYALPVAFFDTRATTGAVTVKFSEGNERFTPLGVQEIEQPTPGEVIFVDEAGLVSARRWCWRQSDESAVNADTTAAIITVEGHHDTAEEDVNSALKDLLSLLQEFGGQGAIFHASMLSPAQPSLKLD